MNEFSSKSTAFIASLGLMIGTGNIWRFPRVLARNTESQGSLVFLVVWFLFTFLWSIPMAILELAIGQFTKKSTILSFQRMVGNHALWVGMIVQLILFAQTCFYTAITGWCLYYVCYIVTYGLPETLPESESVFNDFTTSRWPILFQGLCCLLSGLFLLKGAASIEKFSIVFLPFILALVLFNLLWLISEQNSFEGLEYLFTPTWASLGKASVWVDACSQNAIDTATGTGSLLTYATMMSSEQPILKYGALLPIVNNIVSFSSGITMFSFVFSSLSNLNYTKTEIIELLKTPGPGESGISFIWLPVMYNQAGLPGQVIATLFFMSLFFAGLNSLIAMMETVTRTLLQFGVKSRMIAVMMVVIVHFICGLPSSISLFLLSNQEFVWRVALLLSGLCFQVLLISYGSKRFRTEVLNSNERNCIIPVVWEFVCKFICPLEAVGLLVWWLVNVVQVDLTQYRPWYRMGNTGFFITAIEWFILIMLAVLFNLLCAVFEPMWYNNDNNNDQSTKSKQTFNQSDENDPEIGNDDG